LKIHTGLDRECSLKKHKKITNESDVTISKSLPEKCIEPEETIIESLLTNIEILMTDYVAPSKDTRLTVGAGLTSSWGYIYMHQGRGGGTPQGVP
jgi:hypothetical protein